MNDPTLPSQMLPAMAGQGIESSASAVAAQARAMVESRYVMAMRNPRNWDQVRQDLMKECKRPSFADNKSTYYVKPIGTGVEGLGIRFVEVALRCMKNVLIETSMIFEDEIKEVHRVSVTDLESNITYPMDVRVSKTVERSKPADDGTYISVRKNSRGNNVYTVLGTDDDILNKRGALISKAIRTLGLRVIPGDLQDEAEALIKQVRLDKAAQDPDASRKQIVDAFAELGVQAKDITDYLGHPIPQCSPAELVRLRGLYGAIKDGEASWASVMENKAATSKKTDTDGAGTGGGGDALPPISAERFKKQLPAWSKPITDRVQTVDDLLSFLKGKYTLTPEQLAEVEKLRAPDASTGADTGGTDTSPSTNQDQTQ